MFLCGRCKKTSPPNMKATRVVTEIRPNNSRSWETVKEIVCCTDCVGAAQEEAKLLPLLLVSNTPPKAPTTKLVLAEEPQDDRASS